ncbi:MAG: prephenate dehydrogenase [Chloroflexi bacterium]|nr:prephenate dehydrogenase [Chloroflexota bacterium]
MDDLDGFTIAIAGLGLMGGSLAMTLKAGGARLRVLGADANPDVVRQAQARDVIDGDWQPGDAADIVVLAMPVRGIVAWIETHGPSLPTGTLLMDLGSTKREIVAAMDKLAIESVGGHPMCGKETSGIESADAGLFRGARFALTPTARTSVRAMRLAQSLVAITGAAVLMIEADAHDRAVAAISHLPYVLSATLVNTVTGLNDQHAEQLASTGYVGMTRLAASDTRMMGDIIASNRAAIVAMIDAYSRELTTLRDQIARGDEAAWSARLEAARRRKTGGVGTGL